MSSASVVVVGAGAGGLAAAADLARQGLSVTLLEAASTPGGKMRQLTVDHAQIDAGPTVFTMPWVFEALFKDSGVEFADTLAAVPAEVLARHAWTSGGQLDLYADIARSKTAILAEFGETEAAGFQRFCDRSAGMYHTLRDTFMSAQKPNPISLAQRVGFRNVRALIDTAPQRTLWSALNDYFKDPRLRQLFGRYATYVGSSPLQTPATLMLIAHVEQDGVWLLPGGMLSLASAIADLAQHNGADLRYGTAAENITLNPQGRVTGVESSAGFFKADAVVFAGDHAALSGGLLGAAVMHAVPRVKPSARGLSAVTWCVKATTRGFPLHYHNVFFADDYKDEFAAIFKRGTVCDQPTVYVCAQDRFNGITPNGAERLLILINAPADGDQHAWSETRLAELQTRALALMARCGLTLTVDASRSVATSPAAFHRLFPGSGGSLYGKASHGMMSSFARPGSRSAVPGLYLAGGTVHPGPGVPMATLSGRLAAQAINEDLAAS